MKRGLQILGVVGLVIFIFILSQIDLNKLLQIITEINPYLLALALAVNGIIILLKSLKWKFIVNTIAPRFTLYQSVIGFLVGFSLSIITPGKIGDFVKALYVKDKEHSLGEALSTVIIERLIDIIFLFLFGFLALLILFNIMGIEILSFGIMAVLGTCLIFGVYILFNKTLISKILRPFFNIIVPASFKNKVSDIYNEFYNGLHKFIHNRRAAVSSISIGLISWVFTPIYAYLIALSIQLDISFLLIAISVPIISILDLLPISISGIGTRDAALIFLFGIESISAEQTIAFSLLYLLLSYWFVALIGAVCWLKYPIPIHNTK